MNHSFEMYLDLPEASCEMAEKLYSSCKDATFGQRNGRVYLTFDRESKDMYSAIESAVADVKRFNISIIKICPLE